MKRQYFLNKSLICSGVLMLAMSSAYADPACDAEVVTIQAAIDAPAAEISAADLEQAQQMLNILAEDCDGGSALDEVSSLSDAIRSLLGMEGGS